MAYSSITDILFDLPKNEVISLTNDEKRLVEQIDLESNDDECVKRVNKAIQDADEEINGYLRSRYSLPINPNQIPKLLIKISKDISIYNLFCRRHRIDIPFREVYLSRVKELQLIQKGEINLDFPEGTEDNAGVYVINKTANDRIFNKEILSQF